MTTDTTRKQRLADFVSWVAKHITGDEKGQAHIFLDHLFLALGHGGALDVGGQTEFRIRKAKEDGGGTAFADFVWKPHVLFEMKKRGTDLSRHYRQAFDYWTRLVPGRPRYVVLCNFDEFWVYDFENQMDTPVDQLRVQDLPERYGPLAFLFSKPEKPTFGNDNVVVTREAADRLAECYRKLMTRKVDSQLSQRFVLQMLVALFAQCIDLLPKYFVTQLLEDCKSKADSYDLLGTLFVEMNTPGVTPAGRFQGVPYFDGGLFSQPARIELYADEISQLREASKSNWSKVRPEIFGTIFEHSLTGADGGIAERRAFGAHFTSQVDIMKIVKPTIVDPWRELIRNAKSHKELNQLSSRLWSLRILDPACGSGNFLYVAYREMKRLEEDIRQRWTELSTRGRTQQRPFGFVTASQFYGIDIIPIAVELAKVTMMIGRKLAIDEFNTTENALPLDNLDKNFIASDALIDADDHLANWPDADVIIGNPPFIGAKFLKPERGTDYANSIRKVFPNVPGMADYCVYWIRRAHDHLPDCTAERPEVGRAGLVGTQNIRNNKSRVGGLDYVVQSGTIVEAVDNQPWSGQANVHVSIVNWVRHPPINPRFTEREHAVVANQLLIPSKRRLWYKLAPQAGGRKPHTRSSGPASKEYELAYRDCLHINSALSDQADVSTAVVLRINAQRTNVCQGVTPGHNGFVLSPTARRSFLTRDAASGQVIFPYLVGRELLTGNGTPSRFVIDFGQMSILDARQYKDVLAHIEKVVLPDVQRKAEKEHATDSSRSSHLQHWWTHWRSRRELIAMIAIMPRYLVCSRVTKRPIFVFIDNAVRPGDALQAFTFSDDYSFGILQSKSHSLWFIAKCSKLKSDFRYTPESVFNTCPWPQSPTVEQIDSVAQAGREVRRVRSEALEKIRGGLRAVYRTLELPGKNPLKDVHAALDAAVMAAYSFSPKKDMLAQLLALNLDVAARLDRGEPVTAPGIPAGYPSPSSLVTEDCIRPGPD